MAFRPRRRETQLAFEALSIEGGLLSPDWLSRVAQLSAGHQTEADYRVPKGLNLRDEIGRYWRIAHAHWKEFAPGLVRASGAGGSDALALADRFVQALLRESLGFSSLRPTTPVVSDGRMFPIGLSAVGGRVPVVVAPVGGGLDAPSPMFGGVGRKRSPFGLAQEYLNAAGGSTWGIVSDGLKLRILRDNSSLTRPAWIEADLGRIFSEDRYADFAALWLLAHETRFGRISFASDEDGASECALDVWRAAGRKEGTRAREELREGFKEALLALGQGFLAHPENSAIHAALQSGSLTKNAYFQQLLRLVYRFIFLLTAEERDVLHPPGTADDAQALYAAGYGLKGLRDRSVKRSAHDRFSDLWDATKIVFRGLADGEPRLGLPPLAGLFALNQCPSLDAAKLENRALLLAVFRLSWLRQASGLVRVNWRDMGPEELGSIYESLLELQSQITQEGRAFAFDETKGNIRKETGSYYTPDSLVQVLLESALEPVVQSTISEHPANPIEALLGLSIVDPACGSGHFLLAAARRLASHVARLQSEGTPSAADFRSALRQVVARCIYGVDRNLMAVELCKVSMWMEAVEPGLPLTFLNSHIQHGNALLGTTPQLMATGIPDAAWDPIEGDDKKTASVLKKRNKNAADGQRSLDTLWSKPSDTEAQAVARAISELEAASDANPQALAKKESQWDGILGSAEFRHQKFVADAWCAAFIWPKLPGERADAAPTNELWRQLRDGQGEPPAVTTKTVNELAEQYRFFHWHLQFPQVFTKGGFDVVLGNPPWEHIEIKEEEWFADLPEIAAAPNAAARKRMIGSLRTSAPAVHDEFVRALRTVDGENHLARESGRYPLCARGRINTYALFAEHNRAILGPSGRAGFIVPTGIATDDNTKEFFSSLVECSELATFFSFENEEFVFPAVHHAFRFALMSLDRSRRSVRADLVFFARQVSTLADPNRHFSLSPTEFALLNPNTRTCPTFRSRRDADINIALYRLVGVLWREDDPDGNPWGVRFMQGIFNMASDSALFRTRTELEAAGWKRDGNQYVLEKRRMLPLLEAKMVQYFDHRYGTYEGQTDAQANQGKLPELDDVAHADPHRFTFPKYWVSESEVESRLSEHWRYRWLLGWRRICRSTDQRTLIASLFPVSGVGDSEFLLLSSALAQTQLCLYANLSALVLDYAARQKIGGTNASFHIVRQLPILAPAYYSAPCRWSVGTNLREWFVSRALELTYTAWDLEPFARDCSFDGPPFRWDRERRFALRAELDAAFFHVYGVSRSDVDYILETFSVVKKNDEKAYGDYRTKRAILDIYDALDAASRSEQPYRSPTIENGR